MFRSFCGFFFLPSLCHSKLFDLKEHHAKKSDQGRSHYKNQDVKAYVLYKTPPWHIPAFSKMQKINSIFERKEDPANIQRNVCVGILIFEKYISPSVAEGERKKVRKTAMFQEDENAGLQEQLREQR